MRFTLRTVFLAIALLSVVCAFPLFVSGVVALFVASSLVGGLFILLVLVPFEKLTDKLRRSRMYRD